MGRKNSVNDTTPGTIKTKIDKKTGKIKYQYSWKFKKPNGKWQGTYTKWVDSEKEAVRERAKADKARRRNTKEETARTKDKAISTMAKEYMDYLLKRPLEKGFSASTRRTKYTRMTTLLNVLDMTGLTMDNIDEEDIERWQLNLEEYAPDGEFIKVGYHNSLAGEINSFIDYINKHRFGHKKLAGRIKHKRKEPFQLKEQSLDDEKWEYIEEEFFDLLTSSIVFDPDKYDNVADFPEKRLKAPEYAYIILNFLFYNGLRFEELRPLQWRDIPSTMDYIDINKADNYRILEQDKEQYAKMQDTKNEWSQRQIPMAEETKPFLKMMFKMLVLKHGDEMYFLDRLVFPSRRTGEMISHTAIQKWLDKLCEAEGIPHLSVHGLRHSFAMNNVWNKDMPIDVAVQFMGHSDGEQLKSIYAKKEKQKSYEQMKKWKDEQDRKANKQLEDLQKKMDELQKQLDYERSQNLLREIFSNDNDDESE